MSDTIMVVEDDDATREFLADNLEADSYGVVTAATGRQAFNLLEVKDCDLLLLDVMLPDASGFELCRRLRAADGIAQRIDPELPVIMLTGRASETDRVRGSHAGRTTTCRSRSTIRSSRRASQPCCDGRASRRERGVIQVGDLRIDPASREVSMASGKVELSAKEFALLHALAAGSTRVFTKEELLRDVWGFQLMGSTRTLDSHASRLRRKLRPDGWAALDRERLGCRLPPDGPLRTDDRDDRLVASGAAAVASRRRPTGRRRLLDAGMVALCSHELRGALAAMGLALARFDGLRASTRGANDRGPARTAGSRGRRDEDLEAARGLRRGGQHPEAVDQDIAGPVVAAWNVSHRWRARPLALDWRAGPALVQGTRAPRTGARQSVANALEHGAGRVTVVGRVNGPSVTVSVLDLGDGLCDHCSTFARLLAIPPGARSGDRAPRDRGSRRPYAVRCGDQTARGLRSASRPLPIPLLCPRPAAVLPRRAPALPLGMTRRRRLRCSAWRPCARALRPRRSIATRTTLPLRLGRCAGRRGRTGPAARHPHHPGRRAGHWLNGRCHSASCRRGRSAHARTRLGSKPHRA